MRIVMRLAELQEPKEDQNLNRLAQALLLPGGKDVTIKNK
jgi:hypothetical protein